ncbi:LysR family transcriptional regulator [Sporolactobacillus sp. KGMB 08714]|uniref:LysR family transcriptional regulator n=1 Tax=Sporolactobacillus sp. KGMB 08714 TaxID=3064704 RepID=UPI002FBD50E9
MEFKQLKYFVQVAKDLNYTVASKKLFVTQPTLSWTTKKLEEELGFKLFSYDGKKLALTKEGEKFLGQAQHLLKEYSKTIEFIRRSQDKITGQLKIGIPDLFADCFFIDSLMGFIHDYPGVRTNIVCNGSLAIQEGVQSGKIDVGIISHLNPPITLEVIELPNYSYRPVVIVSKNHRLAGRTSVSFRELKKEKFILLSEEFTLGKLPVIQCIKNGFTPEIKLRSSEWSFICDAVAHSDCISFLPEPLIEKYISGGINVIAVDDDQSVIPISLITKRNVHTSLALQKFVSYFLKANIN